MTQETPNPAPPKHTPVSRTIRRILAEAFFVALLGALVFGIFAEIHLLQPVGMILAIVIWVAGTPTLEVLRLLQSRR